MLSLAGRLSEEALALAGGSVAALERSMMQRDLAGEGAIRQRAEKLTAWIESRSESTLVLVSHGAFLMHLTSDTYMDNCELRSYSLRHGSWTREG